METNLSEDLIIEGGHSSGFHLNAGQCVCIVNLEGSQVVDAWAFCQGNINEFLSNEHTRSCLEKLIPGVGDQLYTNQRRPILSITEDTSAGIHDMLLSACDEQRYQLLGHVGYHRNCTDNLRESLSELGLDVSEIPSPFNIFENVTIGPNGELAIEPPVVKAGKVSP